VNTDGPLTAGLLGKDKPVFDIIGDQINGASRLQSICIAGTVQIWRSTYDLISRIGLAIETRGEIFLKGNKMAYVVRPERAERAEPGEPRMELSVKGIVVECRCLGRLVGVIAREYARAIGDLKRLDRLFCNEKKMGSKSGPTRIEVRTL
jgi:hypothetical protein